MLPLRQQQLMIDQSIEFTYRCRQSTGSEDGHEPADEQGWNVWTEREGNVAENSDAGQDDKAFSAANDIRKHAAERTDEDGGGHVHCS